MSRPTFSTLGFAVVVCRHPETKNFLAVNECDRRGWWLPAGHCERGQDFVATAQREAILEAGIDVDIKGVLAVEHTLITNTSARMRVIFYAEPLNLSDPPKSFPDKYSLGAKWMSLEQLGQLKGMRTPEGLRGEELLRWGHYLNRGGIIAPISILPDGRYDGFFRMEDEGPPISSQNISHILSITTNGDSSSLIQSLLNGTLNVNETYEKQWTLLHHAAAANNLSIICKLLIAGADADMVTQEGRSALHIAASRGNESVVRTLIISGADITLKDMNGMTALDFIPRHREKTSINLHKLLAPKQLDDS